MNKSIIAPTTAEIYWNEKNTPVSAHFDDVYFSDDVAAETQYVFIEGNNLWQRFLDCNEEIFTVGETGFGSGLNFLLLWQFFLYFKQKHPKSPLKSLRFISVEKYPLSLIDLVKIHQRTPTLKNLADQLQNKWATSSRLGFCDFDFPDCKLVLFYGDVMQFADHLITQKILVDAWFFDGFAPNKNQDMWSAELFSLLYKSTKELGTFATFTASGFVRRNLIFAGYKVNKRKGFAHKREMLIGVR